MKTINKLNLKRVERNTPMIFGKAPQTTIDTHYKDILDTVKSGDVDKISFLLACINYLKDRDGYNYIQFAAANAVMSGYLTVNDRNEFVVRPELCVS